MSNHFFNGRPYQLNEPLDCEEMDQEYEDLQSRLSEKEEEVKRLRAERCYICRPDDKLASEEGCSDCDRRSDNYHTIESLSLRVKELTDQLRKFGNHLDLCDGEIMEFNCRCGFSKALNKER